MIQTVLLLHHIVLLIRVCCYLYWIRGGGGVYWGVVLQLIAKVAEKEPYNKTNQVNLVIKEIKFYFKSFNFKLVDLRVLGGKKFINGIVDLFFTKKKWQVFFNILQAAHWSLKFVILRLYIILIIIKKITEGVHLTHNTESFTV